MPRIVRTGGLNLVDDVVKIRDLGPSPVPARPKKPKPKPVLADGMAPEEGEDALAGGEVLPEEGGAEAHDDGEDFAEVGFDTGAMAAGGTGIKEELIQGAMAEAGRILQDALKDAEEQKRQILEQAQAEAEQLRQQAAQQGRAEGRDTVLAEVKDAASRLEGAIAQYEGERAGYESEFEEQLKWMAIEIAGKVLAHKVAEDDSVLADMVNKAVQSVKSEPWIRVEVAQEMVRLVGRLTELYQQQANIEVSAIPAAPGTIQIETPSGVVDASLQTQLENLRSYFASVAQ